MDGRKMNNQNVGTVPGAGQTTTGINGADWYTRRTLQHMWTEADISTLIKVRTAVDVDCAFENVLKDSPDRRERTDAFWEQVSELLKEKGTNYPGWCCKEKWRNLLLEWRPRNSPGQVQAQSSYWFEFLNHYCSMKYSGRKQLDDFTIGYYSDENIGQNFHENLSGTGAEVEGGGGVNDAFNTYRENSKESSLDSGSLEPAFHVLAIAKSAVDVGISHDDLNMDQDQADATGMDPDCDLTNSLPPPLLIDISSDDDDLEVVVEPYGAEELQTGSGMPLEMKMMTPQAKVPDLTLLPPTGAKLRAIRELNGLGVPPDANHPFISSQFAVDEEVEFMEWIRPPVIVRNPAVAGPLTEAFAKAVEENTSAIAVNAATSAVEKATGNSSADVAMTNVATDLRECRIENPSTDSGVDDNVTDSREISIEDTSSDVSDVPAANPVSPARNSSTDVDTDSREHAIGTVSADAANIDTADLHENTIDNPSTDTADIPTDSREHAIENTSIAVAGVATASHENAKGNSSTDVPTDSREHAIENTSTAVAGVATGSRANAKGNTSTAVAGVATGSRANAKGNTSTAVGGVATASQANAKENTSTAVAGVATASRPNAKVNTSTAVATASRPNSKGNTSTDVPTNSRKHAIENTSTAVATVATDSRKKPSKTSSANEVGNVATVKNAGDEIARKARLRSASQKGKQNNSKSSQSGSGGPGPLLAYVSPDHSYSYPRPVMVSQQTAVVIRDPEPQPRADTTAPGAASPASGYFSQSITPVQTPSPKAPGPLKRRHVVTDNADEDDDDGSNPTWFTKRMKKLEKALDDRDTAMMETLKANEKQRLLDISLLMHLNMANALQQSKFVDLMSRFVRQFTPPKSRPKTKAKQSPRPNPKPKPAASQPKPKSQSRQKPKAKSVSQPMADSGSQATVESRSPATVESRSPATVESRSSATVESRSPATVESRSPATVVSGSRPNETSEHSNTQISLRPGLRNGAQEDRDEVYSILKQIGFAHWLKI